MEEYLDRALEVDFLAAALSGDRRSSGYLLECIAQKLQLFLPRNMKVERNSFGLGSR